MGNITKKLTKAQYDAYMADNAASKPSVPLLIEPYAYGSKTTAHASKYDKDQWRKWAQETGFKPTKRTVAEQNKEFQLYLLQDDKFKDKVKAIHEELGMPYAGKPDDQYLGERWDKIMEKLTTKPAAAAVTPAATTPALADEKEKDETDYDGIYTDHLEETRYPPVAPAWWLQDKLAATNAGINALNIKQYNPYEPPVRYQTARGQYLSPERALAENRSIMNSQLNAVAQYGPQSMNARFSDIAGKSFANAANVIGNVHNQNQLIGNQLEQFNTGIKNQETRENVAHATSLWDKYQATRQNFDTERKRAFDNLTNVVNQGITNRANTYNLNQINPQTAVNPGQGGTMYFHSGRDLKGSTTPATINEAFAANMRNKEYKRLADTPQGQQILWSLTQKQLGLTEDAMDQYGKNRNIPNQQVPVPSGYQGGYNQDA